MKILFVCPSYNVAWGGPPKMISGLTKELSRAGVEIDILCTYGNKNDELVEIPENVNLISFKRAFLSKIWPGFSFELITFLLKNASKYDFIHIHELWHFPGIMAGLSAGKNRYIVTPHGELDEWRLRHKWLKKKAFSSIQKHILQNAASVHILTENEKYSLLNYISLPAEKIKLIPNSVAKVNPVKTDLPEELKDKKYLLFLSRVHPMKGVTLLLQAFAEIKDQYPELYLFIAGPVEKSYETEFEFHVNQAGKHVKALGMIFGELKNAVLSNASGFILPSFSEGFPMSVLEAIQYKLPLIISDKTGVDEILRKANAAIIIEAEKKSIKEGIKKWMNNASSEQMTENALQLLRREFDPEQIALKFKNLYEELIRKNQ